MGSSMRQVFRMKAPKGYIIARHPTWKDFMRVTKASHPDIHCDGPRPAASMPDDMKAAMIRAACDCVDRDIKAARQ
jgi:hypothetical protein